MGWGTIELFRTDIWTRKKVLRISDTVWPHADICPYHYKTRNLQKFMSSPRLCCSGIVSALLFLFCVRGVFFFFFWVLVFSGFASSICLDSGVGFSVFVVDSQGCPLVLVLAFLVLNELPCLKQIVTRLLAASFFGWY